MNIEHKLCDFLQSVIDQVKPHLIVPVERKGTAILRTLIDNLEGTRLDWQWSRVISSAVLRSVTRDRLADRRILIFDELLRHGRRVTDTMKALLDQGVSAENISTAVFAVHEDCTRELEHFRYSELDDEWYARYRREIVEMLQRRGSLLLDTEHVEVLVRIEGSVKDFVDMLSACGQQVAVFRSGSNRLNITLDQPKMLHHEALDALLPQGSDLQGVVNKCRVVRTNNPSEFALIPIFFADTPEEAPSEWYKGLPSFLQADNRTPLGVFYTVGLLAALHVLGSVVSILRGFEGVIIDCPRFVSEGDSFKPGRAAAPLNHLLAMYPQVKGSELEEYVSEIMLQAKAVRPKKSHSKPLDVSDSELDLCVRKLGAMIVTETDDNLSYVAEQADQTGGHLLGLPNRSLFQLAEKRLNISRSLTSAAVDRLIDEAYLVTKVEKTQQKGIPRWGRTFEPDGELASSCIRRFIAEHHPLIC